MLSPVPIRLDNDSYYCGERQRADNGASEHPEASRNMLRKAKPDETGWGWRDKPHSDPGARTAPFAVMALGVEGDFSQAFSFF